ncbi:MAG: hypothetical protein M3N43_14740 [Actinomycetota bacterium]|nr:hypothetical protein [Actinomycetota bacterium]
MAIKVTVRIGGDAGSTTWNATSQVRVFGDYSTPLLTASHRYDMGASSQFELEVDDDVGEIPRVDLTRNLASHNVVTVSEDASGTEYWIARGRIADKGWGRGDKPWGNARAANVRVDDGNIDLKGLNLTAHWVRGAETGRARTLAALAAFCNGAPRLTTVIATHLVAAGGEVVMPAKTYLAGAPLGEILEDCAAVEGKLGGVVLHHSGGSHLCYLYIDEDDHSTYLSTYRITDTSPNLTTQYPPQWEQGDATVEMGGENPISTLISRHGSGDDSFVVSTDTTIITAYDYWAETFNDSTSVNATQAQRRADSTRRYRGREHVTHQVTIQLRADQVHLVEAGMSIEIRAAAAMAGQYLGTVQTRRIAQCKKEPIAPDVGAVVGFYNLHLMLDRPQKILPEKVGLPVGPKPPAAGTVASCTLDVGQMTAIATPNGGFETGLTTNWTMNHISGGVSGPGTGQWEGDYHYALNSAGFAAYEGYAGYTFLAGVPYVVRFRVHETSGCVVRFGQGYADGTGDVATTGVDQGSGGNWEEFCLEWTPSANRDGSTVGFLIGKVSGLDSFLVDDLRTYTGGVGQQSGAGVGTVVGTGSGAAGSADTYMPAGSALEHTLITAGGPYHEAADVTAADAGGFYAGTTVEAQLQEVRDLNARVGVRKNSAGSTFIRRRVNLIEGSNVTLTVADDSGNEEVDVTIAATGGSGSLTVQDEGTPLATDATTLNFVGGGVTATGAGATKTITIPGGGGGAAQLPLDAAATAAVGSGDLFGGTTLDGGWSDLQTTALDTKSRAVDGYLILGNNAAMGTWVWRGLDRAFSPAGDFTIWTRVEFSRHNGDYQGFCVFAGATDPSDAAGANRIQAALYNGTGVMSLTMGTIAAGVHTLHFDTQIHLTPMWMYSNPASDLFPMWLAIRRVGTALSAGVSEDGVEWTWHTTTSTIGFTVNTCGLALLQQGTANPTRTVFDYIATAG